MNGLLQFLDPCYQCITVRFQFLSLHCDTLFLHVVQHQRKGHLHLFQETLHACCLQLVLQNLFALTGDIGSVAGIFHGFPWLL